MKKQLDESTKSEVDYDLLNLRFEVRMGITKIIINCEQCGNHDHIFQLPDGNWTVKDIINNMELFVFGKCKRYD